MSVDEGEQAAIDEVEAEYKEAKAELKYLCEDDSSFSSSYLDEVFYKVIDDMETLPQVKKLLKDNVRVEVKLSFLEGGRHVRD